MPESETLNDIVGGRLNCSKMSVRQPYATAPWHHLVSNQGIRQDPSSNGSGASTRCRCPSTYSPRLRRSRIAARLSSSTTGRRPPTSPTSSPFSLDLPGRPLLVLGTDAEPARPERAAGERLEAVTERMRR